MTLVVQPVRSEQRSTSSCRSAVEALGGKLDILVNNAGVTRDNLAMRMKDEELDEVIKVNLEAAFRLMRAAMKPMMKARFGRIISITSVVGVTGNPGQANYVASKAGLIGMSKAFAQEVASRGITVNCVAPGFMTSAMTDALNDAQKEAILSKIPTGAMGSGDDIGAAVVYLASPGKPATSPARRCTSTAGWRCHKSHSKAGSSANSCPCRLTTHTYIACETSIRGRLRQRVRGASRG